MTNIIRKSCTKKIIYENIESAGHAAVRYQKDHGTVLKAYECRYCGLYHLTKGDK